MSRRKHTARPKLSPVQFIKGSIIRVGLAKKVKVRGAKPTLNRDGRETNVRFQFIWHRVLLLFVALGLVGWISLATGGYFFVKHARDFPGVKFVDILFPHRWDHYRVARGDYYIEQAQEKLAAGDFGTVIHLVRVGVQQSPNNKEGRVLLAQIYNMLGRPDLGIETLRVRVDEHVDDTDYLGMLISLLFANHEDEAVEELSRRLLGGSLEPTDRNLILAIAAATANFNRGNYGRAEEIIEDFKLLQARTGMLLQARIDWEVGHRESAIQRLETIMTNPGPQEAQVVDYLIEYLWSSGQERRAEQFAFVRFMADPLSYAPKIRLLYIYEKRGDKNKESAEIESFFQLFGEEQEALLALGQFAARTGNEELAERIYRSAQEQGHDLSWFELYLVEARIAGGSYRQAISFFESIQAKVADWTPLQRAQLNPLLIAAHFGVSDVERGDSLLGESLASRNINPADLMTLSERLMGMGEHGRARQVLQGIYRNQPLNQEALTRLIRLDLNQGNRREMVDNLQRLMQMRKPSIELLQDVRRHLGGDRFIFQGNRGDLLESLDEMLLSRSARAS